MNINDITIDPAALSAILPDYAGWEVLLGMRQKTMAGFAELECRQGIVRYPVSLASKPGQEMVRLFLMRSVEEVLEALDSVSEDHHLEELIDALNYMLIIPMLEGPNRFIVHHWLELCAEGWSLGRDQSDHGQKVDLHQYLQTAAPLLERLRNRAWQWTAQDTYFNGWAELRTFIRLGVANLTREFPDWETFRSFFIRKDAVLQFRLQSRY